MRDKGYNSRLINSCVICISKGVFLPINEIDSSLMNSLLEEGKKKQGKGGGVMQFDGMNGRALRRGDKK